MIKTLKYQAVMILLLEVALSQNQIFVVSKHFVPFEDKSAYSQEYYRWPSEGYLWVYGQSRGDGGSYSGCREAEEAVAIRPRSFPKNLSLLISDMSGLGISVFTIMCGTEVLSHGAGYFRYGHHFIGFEKANKHIAYLFLCGEQQTEEGSISGTVSDLQRLDKGVYGFTRTSIGTWGYTQEYFLFTVSKDRINILIDGLPLSYFPENASGKHSPQLQVSIYWPSSFEVIPLNNNLTPEQQKWVGIFNF
jgi:hypothetical protein